MVKEIRGCSGAGSVPEQRVDVCADSDEDRGSTPLASISDFKFLKTGIQLSNEHERKRPCQSLQCLVALAKGSISWRRTSVWCNSLTRAFTLPRRRPSE